MFGFFKRKKEGEYHPQFEHEKTGAEESVTEQIAEEEEEYTPDPYAELEVGDTVAATEDDGETVRLEDGREFPASFVREVRAARAEELKLIIEEQAELYTEAEFAYIREVFAERLGD